jgi:competence protein ComFB
MGILNIMEDKIKATVNDILSTREDRFLLTNYIDDIVAYVLNRVPPRYITSERGFIHNEIDFSINTQLQADIRFCIDDAINTLVHRREPVSHTDILEDIVDNHYYFPHIIGEVLDESTFSITPNIEVRLQYNDRLVPMIDPGWTNPYFTCTATKGYYVFWPDFIRGEMNPAGDNIFKIVFRHKDYHKQEKAFTLRALENFSFSTSKIIPLTLLHQKAN